MNKVEESLNRIKKSEIALRAASSDSFTSFINSFHLFRDMQDYERQLRHETSVKLTVEQLQEHHNREIMMLQFDVDILKNRFRTLSDQLRMIWNMGSEALRSSDISMELRALNAEIISKTDYIEERKFRHAEIISDAQNKNSL